MEGNHPVGSGISAITAYSPELGVFGNGEVCDCRVEFPESTLPSRLWGIFLVSMEYKILKELGETAPFETRILLHTGLGFKDIEDSAFAWNRNDPTICLKVAGPHAHEVSSRLAPLVDQVLRTTTFDQDGFVVNGG